MTVTILSEAGETCTASAKAEGDGLWLDAVDVEGATGWTIKPEGLCRGEICVPSPAGDEASFVRDGRVNVAGFWRRMGAPVAATEAGDVWSLGVSADERAEALLGLEAPDFSLPDLDGRLHSLSDYRGKKVLLATWASW